jgi:hypothetical protein
MRYLLSLHDVNGGVQERRHAYGLVKPTQKGKTNNDPGRDM